MNVLSFIIEAKDKATATLNKIKGQFGELKADWAKAMAGMKEGSYSGLLSFGMKMLPVIGSLSVAFRGLGDVFAWVGRGIEENIKLEKLTIQMSRVTGSMRSARAEVEALTKGGFAVDDLFGEEDVIRASMALRKFSSQVIGTAGDVKLMAAAAYATNQSVSDVAHSVGLLTGKILAGDQSWGRYAEQLVKSGVLSRDMITTMEGMQAAGKGAGEMVALLMSELNRKYSGTLEEARASLDGIRKSADDAAGDAMKAWGESYQGLVKIFHKIREGWWNVVEWIASNPITFDATDMALKVSRSVSEKMFGKKAENKGDGPTSIADIISKGNAVNAAAPETDEERKKRESSEKSAAEDAAKLHAELLDKKSKAQDRYDEEARTRQQKLNDLTKEKAGLLIDTQSRDSDGTDAAIKAETRILEINAELLKLKKEITAEDEKRAEKEESLMKRDRALREMGMTVEQKREASKKRALDLSNQLTSEKDPDKRLEIKGKLMEEAEKQASMKGGLHSLSVSDLYTKADKGVSGGKRDPAAQQIDILKIISTTLQMIEKKPGGMTK